jgi:hypothetical protein
VNQIDKIMTHIVHNTLLPLPLPLPLQLPLPLPLLQQGEKEYRDSYAHPLSCC